MDKTDWMLAFQEELTRLRPHLAPSYGSSKLLGQMAVTPTRRASLTR